MDIFKLVGSIFIKNQDANEEIDRTSEKAKTMSERIGSAMQTAGDKITGLGKKLAPISTMTGALLTGSVKGASDFQDGIAKMSTLFDTTKTNVKDLADQFLDLSNKTGLSVVELTDAGYQALSAGQSVEDVGKFVETAGNLAKAGFTSTATAVDVLTTAINAYGDDAGTADEIANKLVRTQNLGKTTVDELASSMGKIIPTASGMNVNIDNLTSGYVSLTKQGIATAEATTYMNSMLNELGDSGTNLGKVIKEKTGKSFQDLMEEGWSLGDVLKLTKDYADDNNIAYNELWGSAEAGKSAMAILNGGVDEFNDTVGIMADKTDEVAGAVDKLKTPSQRAKESINRLKNSGIELGNAFMDVFLPVFDKVVSGVEKVTTWFSNLDDGTKQTIATVLTVVTALSPVLIIGGKIISGIGTVIGVIGKLKTVLTVIGGGFKVLWGIIMANPVGAIMIAITGLIILFMHLWDTSEEFRNFWINLWNKIKSFVTNAVNAIKTTAINVWTATKNKAIAIWNGLKTGVTNILNKIKTTASNIWNSIKNAITNIVNAIKSKVTSVWNSIKNAISNILTSIKSKVSDIWNGIKTTISNAISKIKSTITNGLNSAKDKVSSILTSIKDKFKSIMDTVKSVVKSGIDRVKSIFNFSWSLPKLKLPHFSVSGKFSLNPPSIPKFGIDWYKKAMNDPFMMKDPTVFGINPVTGRMKVGGEAGDEVVYGHERLMNDIRNASGSEAMVERFNYWMGRLFDLFLSYFPRFEKQQVVLDTGVVAGEITPIIDRNLGEIKERKGRGN